MPLKMKNSHFVDHVYDVIANFILWFAMIVVLIPILYIISSSFSDARAVVSGKVFLWPVKPTLVAYTTIFKFDQILTGYSNSLRYALIGTAINLFMTVIAAYPLSRKDFKARKFVMMLFTFTMIFSGGLIPTYILVKELNMIDSIWAMVIPNAMGVWNVIIARTFIQTNIPDELYECASLEGCGDIWYVIRIVVPLSKPIIAVMGLMYGVGHWNSFMNGLIYLTDQKLYPLQLVLRSILINNQFDINKISSADVTQFAERMDLQNLLKYSLIIVASVPVFLVYPFIQKYFVKGIMIGSIKG